jgi:hypothetical protein
MKFYSYLYLLVFDTKMDLDKITWLTEEESSILSYEDRINLITILNTSHKTVKSNWRYPFDRDNLIYNDRRTIGDTIPDKTAKNVQEELLKFLGIARSYYTRDDGFDWNIPGMQMMGDCYRIEARKQFIGELEKVQEILKQRLNKPCSKRRKKDIEQRIRKLQKRIDINKAGTSKVFLEDIERSRSGLTDRYFSQVFEYTTIIPLMQLSDNFQIVLDIIEKSGVPHVELLRNLQQNTKDVFLHSWLDKDFVPYASVYLNVYKERAVEDIIRRLPAVTYGGEFGMTRNPSLEHLLTDSKIKKEIRKLHLPRKETMHFLCHLGSNHHEFGDLKLDFLVAARDFYREQLQHSNTFFRWIAARALADSYRYLTEDDYHMPKHLSGNADAILKKMQHRVVTPFIETELEGIITALQLDKRYPHLAQHPELIAERLLRLKPYKLKKYDPYELRTLDDMLPNLKKAGKILGRYGVQMTLFDFIDKEDLEQTAKGIAWVAEYFDKYSTVAQNAHFRRLISREFNIIKYLKEMPRQLPVTFDHIKNIAIELEKYAQKTAEFEDMYAYLFNRVGIDENVLSACDIYLCYLDNSFDEFMHDFEKLGDAMKHLPHLKAFYKEAFDDEKLKRILKYVVGKTSRDLMNTLADVGGKEGSIHRMLSHLDEKTGKKELVHVVSEFINGYNAMRDMKGETKLHETLEQIKGTISAQQMLQLLCNARIEFYAPVIGKGIIVPKGIEQVVDDITITYYKNSGRHDNVDIKPALSFIAQTYLRQGPEATFRAIQELEPNKKIREKYNRRNINIDAFKEGIQKSYTLRTVQDQAAHLQERINSELGIIHNRLALMGLDSTTISNLRAGTIAEQAEAVQDILSSYQFDSQNIRYKAEIKGHLHNIQSLHGAVKETEDEVLFYASTDAFEALRMGSFFHSCLSIGRLDGVNAWASVVQVMDANKNVIYARGSQGTYYGRNRMVLTNNGIVCTRFYSNGGMAMDDAWLDYLVDLGRAVSTDVLIPKIFVGKTMQDLLDNKVQQKTAALETRTLRLEPAYFQVFYGDGLSMGEGKDGAIDIMSQMYVLQH